MAFKTGVKIPSIHKIPREVSSVEKQATRPVKPRIPSTTPRIRVRAPKFKLLPNIRGTGGL